MREIKFRFWSEFAKNYLESNAVFDLIANEKLDPINNIPEQFTGLTDKNGVEIYEGDMIIAANKRVYEVRFGEFAGNYKNEVGIGFFVKNEDECEPFSSPFTGFDYEVIGNIHDVK